MLEPKSHQFILVHRVQEATPEVTLQVGIADLAELALKPCCTSRNPVALVMVAIGCNARSRIDEFSQYSQPEA